MNFKLFNFSWNDKGDYILMVGENNYQFNREHLKFWMRHLLELILEIILDVLDEKEGKNK